MTKTCLLQKVAYLRCHRPTVPSIVIPHGRHVYPSFDQYRHYVRKRPTPSFNAGAASHPHEAKSNNNQDQSEEPSKDPPPRPIVLITPGKLVIYALITYFGYKFYTWQTNPRRSLILNPKFFTPFILQSKESVSPTSSVFNLLSVPLGQNTDNIIEACRTGVWSVQVIQPDLQIARSYTPLPPTEGTPNEQVRLFVRKEVQGEVSGFLHRISPGTLVHMRGPHLEYQIPDDLDEVLFLAGGTGIAPALQVAYTLFSARARTGKEAPRMRILWANRRREDSRAELEAPDVQHFRTDLMGRIRGAMTGGGSGTKVITKPLDEGNAQSEGVKQTRLVEEIEQLAAKSAGKVSVEYFVDEEGSFITESLLGSLLGGDSPSEVASSDTPPPKKKLLLISGPDGFINTYAGPKEWQGGKEIPGPLGGMLMQLKPRGWEIWKL